MKARTRDERTTTNEGELLREIKTLQLERQKLKKRLEEQALTIHELTLQEDEEEEGDEEQSFICSNEQVGFDPGVSSCAESYPSPGSHSEVSSRRLPDGTYRYPLREPSVGFWLPQGKRLSNRPRSRSPLKVSARA